MSITAIAPTEMAQNIASMAQLAKDKLQFAKALKATNIARGKAVTSRKAAIKFTRSHSRVTGVTLASALSSPSLYHLGLKTARKTGLMVTDVVTFGIDVVSLAVGEVGRLLSKVVGLFSPQAGKSLQMGSWGLTSLITETAVMLRNASTIIIESNFSVAYSPTVTRNVTLVARSIIIASFVNMMVSGRIAAAISTVPFFGPIIAASLVGVSGAWTLLRMTWMLSSLYLVVRRPHEAYDIYSGRVETMSFVDEMRQEMHIAKEQVAVVEAAEQATFEAVDTSLADAVVAQAQADFAEADDIVASINSRNRHRNKRNR